MSRIETLRNLYKEIPNWCKTVLVHLYHKSDEIPFTSKGYVACYLFDVKSKKGIHISKNRIDPAYYYKGEEDVIDYLREWIPPEALYSGEVTVSLYEDRLFGDKHMYELLQDEMTSFKEMSGYKMKVKAKVNKPKCKKFPKLNVEAMF